MTDGSSLTGRPPVVGAVIGACAWVVGYLITYVLTVTTLSESSLGEMAQLGIDWQVVGWAFFGAHFVPIVAESGDPLNLIGAAGGPALLLYLVPVAVLVGAGALAALWTGADDINPAVHAGTYVVLGYGPLAIAGTFLFQASFGPLTVGPDPIFGVVLAGGVYPVACGSFGGGLFHELT